MLNQTLNLLVVCIGYRTHRSDPRDPSFILLNLTPDQALRYYCEFRISIRSGNGNDQNLQGGGYFQKFFGQGGILPEVSNLTRKSRFLALLSHN